MAEISVEQYEFLVSLIRGVSQQLTKSEEYWKETFGNFQIGLKLQGSSLAAIEQDISRAQKDIRSIAQAITNHDQALDGLTQLGKTNFDLLESLQRHIHGESSSIEHDRALSSERAQ